MYVQRKTINTTVSITGIGLHSGIYTRVALHPAPAGNGINFVRADLDGLRIPALQASTTALDYATTVGKDDVAVGTVEHLHGMHVFADAHAQGLGEQPQWLYTVFFDGQTLWGAGAYGRNPLVHHANLSFYYIGLDRKVLRLDQGLADAYWQRGVLRQRQGAVRDAITDLTKALALRPSRHEAHAALADAYYDLGREAEAMKEWQQAILAQPDNATWRFRYGKLLAANHQSDAAIEQLTKALQLIDAIEPPPRWRWEAHHALARSLGNNPEAA